MTLAGLVNVGYRDSSIACQTSYAVVSEEMPGRFQSLQSSVMFACADRGLPRPNQWLLGQISVLQACLLHLKFD